MSATPFYSDTLDPVRPGQVRPERARPDRISPSQDETPPRQQQLLSRQDRLPQLLQRFVRRGLYFRPARDGGDDWGHISGLVRDVYIDELGAFKQVRRDCYEDSCDTFLGFCGERAVATIRFVHYRRVLASPTTAPVPIRSGRRLLPMEKHFPLDRHLPSDGSALEASRLIVSQDFRRGGLMMLILALLYQQISRYRIRRTFSFMNYSMRSLPGLYAKSGWRPLSLPFFVADYGALSMPMMLSQTRAEVHLGPVYESMLAKGLLRS